MSTANSSVVVLSQVVKILRSQNLLAFVLISTFPSEIGYLVGSFPIWAELPVYRVLGVPNNLSQNEISN